MSNQDFIPEPSADAISEIERETGELWNVDMWKALVRYLTETKEGRQMLITLLGLYRSPQD